jgi:hypothetical protein
MRVRPGISRGALLTALVVAVVELLIVFFALKVCAMPSKILYTLPSMGQHCYQTVSAEGDSIEVCDCVGTTPIRQLQTSYLWGARITGGGFALVDSHSVQLREGQPDSFPVPWAGNFYIVTRNTKGPSCPSEVVTILPDVTTGVELGPLMLQYALYDVHGRYVGVAPAEIWGLRRIFTSRDFPKAEIAASGIYFVVPVSFTGPKREWARKIVVLR